jgi:hypothetical protein
MKEVGIVEQGGRDKNDLARRFRHDVYGQSQDYCLNFLSLFVDEQQASAKLTTILNPLSYPPASWELAA